MRVRLLLASASVLSALFAIACGDGAGSGIKQLYVEPPRKSVLPDDPFKGKSPDGGRSPVQEALSRGTVENNVIILDEYDTLSLLSKWSGIPDETLLRDNSKVRDFGLVPGQGFLIRLTDSEFLAFQQLREANRIMREVQKQRETEIESEIEYEVQKGETSADIAKKFGAPLELFESMNPLAKSLALQPGQVVKVPIMKNAAQPAQEDVAGSKSVRDRVPGLSAPNPTPVPVPPPIDGKKMLVAPKPLHR